MTEVIIGNKGYKYAFGLGAMMIYESITGEPYVESKKVSTILVTHYACLVNADKEVPLTFGALVEQVDNPATMQALAQAFNTEVARWNSLNATCEEQEPDKKKV